MADLFCFYLIVQKLYVDMTGFLHFVYLFTGLISENIRNAGNLQAVQASPMGLKVLEYLFC